MTSTFSSCLMLEERESHELFCHLEKNFCSKRNHGKNNLRITRGWSGKGLLVIIWSNLLLKQNHCDLQLVSQDHVQMAFSVPPDGQGLHQPSGLSAPVLSPLTAEMFPGVPEEPPMFHFVPSVCRYHWEEPGSVLVVPLLQLFILIMRLPLSLLQVEQPHLSQPFLIGKMLWSPVASFYYFFNSVETTWTQVET